MIEIPKIALSVRQPWAWALFNGKHLENRTAASVKHMKRKPGMRIAIHAAKGMTQREYEHGRALIVKLVGHCPRPDELVRSAIIGHVRYVDTIKHSHSPWFFGPRALLFEDQHALEKPIGCVGALGLFPWAGDDLSDELKRAREIETPLPWMKRWTELPAQPDLAPPRYIHAQQGDGPLFGDFPDPSETPNAREIVERHAAAGSEFARDVLAACPIDERTTDAERAGVGERGYFVKRED